MNPKVDKWVRKAGSWCEKACPRTRSGWIMIALTAVVIVAGVVWLLRPRSEAVHYPIVAVEPVATQNVEIYGEFVGRIRAQQFVEVRARVEGYLERMLFREGSYVKKGQTLFIIDPKIYRARVDKAKAQLNKDRALAQKAERDLKRIRPLYAQNAASQLDLDNATAAYESATANVLMSEADLMQAATALGYTTVQSPITGYISASNADIGTLVGPGGKSLLATIVKKRYGACRFQHDRHGLPAQQGSAMSIWGRRIPRAAGTPTSPSPCPITRAIRCGGWSISPTRRSTPRREPFPCAPRCPTPTISCCPASSPRSSCCSTCVRMPWSYRPRRS